MEISMPKIDLRELLQNKLIANTNAPTDGAAQPNAKPKAQHQARRFAPPVRMNKALRPRRRS
jgi:hypothetical protein